jgi:transposase
MLFVPLANKRHIRVTQQHTKKDFVHCMKWLVDEIFPEATLIRVILDNLAAHRPAALYETFAPQEARRILRKLGFHYKPKHGSWPNMAEIELRVLGRTMKNYIPEIHRFDHEAHALTNERNSSNARVNWQFRTDDARIKLKQLYPSISP